MAKNCLNQISEANKANEVTEFAKSTKKTKRSAQAQTSPLLQMKLIQPGFKRRVKLTVNAVENTPSKQTKMVDLDAARLGAIK